MRGGIRVAMKHFMENQNGVIRLGMTNPVPDGLPLEYKRDYGTARRNLNLSDLINKPAAQGKVRIFSLGLPKEFFDGGGIKRGSLLQNLSDSVVISPNTIKPLK